MIDRGDRVPRTSRQTAVVMGIIAVTSVVGFAREVAFAARFGTSAATDAWGSAAVLLAVATELLLLSGPIATLAIPVLTERRLSGEATAERRALTALFLVLVGGAVVMAVSLSLGSRPFAALLAPGFDSERRQLLFELLTFVGAAIAPITAAGVLAAALSSRHRFARPALTGVAMHLAILVSLVWFVPRVGIAAVGVAVAVGALLQLLLQAPALKTPGLGGPPDWGAVGDVARLTLPVLAISLLREGTLVLERVFASTLPTGQLATLYFAGKLEQFPLGLFATTVAVVAYPAFAELAIENRLDTLGEAVARAVRLVALLAVPSAVGLAVLARPIVRLLFGHGAFGEASIQATAVLLVPLSIGLVGQSIIPSLMRAYFSLKDLRPPVRVLGWTLAVNLVLDAVLVRLGAIGLGVAFAITMTVGAAALGVALARRVPFAAPLGLGHLLPRLGLAAAAVGGAAWGMSAVAESVVGHASVAAEAASTLAGVVAGAAAYALVLHLTGVDEFRQLLMRMGFRRASGAA